MRAAVNENFVGAATQFAIDHGAVDQRERTVVARFDVRVITRRARIVQDDGVVGRAADGAGALGAKSCIPIGGRWRR